jgi:hypothetical protein
MAGSDAVQPLFRHKPHEVLVAQLPGSRFHAQVSRLRVFGDIAVIRAKLERMALSQARNEFRIGIRFSTAQIVIEVNYREHQANFLSQFKQQPQKRD